MASIELVIDTDIIIDFLRRRSNVLAKVVENHPCFVTAITVYELQAIAVQSTRQEQALHDFLQIATVLPFHYKAAEQAATIWRQLRSQGELIGLPDTLIAGTCLAFDLPLFTRNHKHYERVRALKLLSATDLVI